MKKDKVLHLLAGFVISFLIGLYNPVYGVFAGVAAGFAKEAFDFFYNKYKQEKVATVEMTDFVTTAIGAILAYIVLML